MKFNKAFLNYLIARQGYTNETFAKKAGFSITTWYRKLKNEDLFTYSDIKKIVECLNLEVNEITDVFFKR